MYSSETELSAVLSSKILLMIYLMQPESAPEPEDIYSGALTADRRTRSPKIIYGSSGSLEYIPKTHTKQL